MTKSHDFSFSRHDLPELCQSRPSMKQRAQGTPDVGRTREPCVQENAHWRTQATTGQPGQPAFPAQWFYGLYVISSVRRAFWPPSPRKTSPRDLIPASGDRDRTISPSAPARFVVSAEHPRVHRIPLPTSVTTAIRPSCGGGTRAYNHKIPKNGRTIFLSRGLDLSPIDFR